MSWKQWQSQDFGLLKKHLKIGYVKFRRSFGLLKKYLKIGCVKFRRRFLTYET